MSDKKKEDDKIWYARIVGKDENSMNVEVSGCYELVHKITALLNFNEFVMNNRHIENIRMHTYLGVDFSTLSFRLQFCMLLSFSVCQLQGRCVCVCVCKISTYLVLPRAVL